MYLAYREQPKKKWLSLHEKISNASTHQPAHRKICLTLIMCINMHFHSIFFLSTFNTSKHIFIDFVVLLHWTTQQNKSASLRFGLTWHWFLKKKKSMAKFAKLVWLAAVQLFYFLSFFFFFSYIMSKQKKKKRERSKSNFWKGMPKTNVCCNAVPENQPPLSSIKQAQGLFLQVDAAVLHLHNIHPACLLPPPANQVTYHSLNCSGPNMRWSQ